MGAIARGAIECPGPNDRLALLFLFGELQVQGQELFKDIVAGFESVGFQDGLIEFGVQFGEAAGGFMEIAVVELGDAPLALFHDLGAVIVQILGDLPNVADDFLAGFLGKGKRFKAGVMGISRISLEG